VLTRLTRDGLVSRVEKDGRLHIAAEDPGRLLGVLEDRRRTVEEVLPELRSRYSLSAARPRIRFYEGRDGITTVLDDTLECRSKRLKGILSMASDPRARRPEDDERLLDRLVARYCCSAACACRRSRGHSNIATTMV
jgi:hypothetical protein